MVNQKPNPDSDLENRLSKLGNKLDKHSEETKKAEKKASNRDSQGMAYGLKIASEFASAIIVGGALGWAFDYWVGTSPFGLIVLLMLGFAAGVVNVMRATGQMASK